MLRIARAAALVTAVAACLVMADSARADVHMDVRPDGSIWIHGTGKFHGSGGSGAAPGVVPVPPSDHDVARYTRYDDWIRSAATLYQIPEQLVRAIIRCESDYDPRAVSVSGARGLMQLMPDTANLMQVRDIDDPRENIFGGVRLLRILANEFNGDLELTVAAYNAGDGNVIRFGGIPPFDQTRQYVIAVTRFYRRYRSTPDPVEASVGG